MAEKHTVAMFVQNDAGERVQVGWASPKNESGVRTFEYSPGYEQSRPRDVSFEDDELTQLVAQEQHEARAGDGTDGDEFEIEVHPTNPDSAELLTPATNPSPVVEQEAVTSAQDAEPIEDAPDETQADDFTDGGVEQETVELNSGGSIEAVVPEVDEEAEFQRELAEEEAQQAQTRRELRENEENN